jgi:hypothetical protein
MQSIPGGEWGRYANEPVTKRGWSDIPHGVKQYLFTLESEDAKKWLTAEAYKKYKTEKKSYQMKEGEELQMGSRSPRSISRARSGSRKKRSASPTKKARSASPIPVREGAMRPAGAGWEVYKKGKWEEHKGAVFNAEGKYGGPFADARQLQAVPAYIADLRAEFGLAANMSAANVVKAAKTARRAATVAAKAKGGSRRKTSGRKTSRAGRR